MRTEKNAVILSKAKNPVDRSTALRDPTTRGQAPWLRMTKALALLLALVMLLPLCLSGCHGHKSLDAFQIPESFDTSRQFEITFWAKNDTNLTQVGIYKKAIADFEALYPNIKVKLKLYTDYGRIYGDAITNIRTGTPPDVCISYPDHIATYMEGKNTVVSLDALMADEKYGLGGSELRFDGVQQGQIIEKFLQEGQIIGQQYALPFMRSTEACYINKTLLEKLGFTLPEQLTWDFIWEVSEAAMALGKYTGLDKNGDEAELWRANDQTVLIPFIYKSTDNMMIQMLRQKGADYSDSQGNIGIFNDTTAQLLKTISQHAQSRAFSTFKISSYPGNFLNAGQCIFAIDSTAGATWIGTDAPSIDIKNPVEFEAVVMQIPQFDTENPQMISQGPSVCVFNKEDPQQVLASWLFAQFLLTNEVQIAYAQTEGYVPVTSKAQNSAEYQDYLSRSGEDNDLYYRVKLDATKLLLDNIDNTFITPVFNGSASLRNAAGQMIEECTKAPRRGVTVNDSFIQELFTDTNYHLSVGVRSADSDLGPMPKTAVVLLVCLAASWVTMGGIFLRRKIKNKVVKN